MKNLIADERLIHRFALECDHQFRNAADASNDRETMGSPNQHM